MDRNRTPMLGLVVASVLLMSQAARADEFADVDRLIQAGQWGQVVQVTDKYLASHPRDARMRFSKGLALTEQGRLVEAASVFVKLTEEFPDRPEPYNNLAVLYSKQGQYDQARRALESAVRANPGFATAYENLGDVYAKLAAQAYSRSAQLDAASASKVGPKLAMIRNLLAPSASATATADSTKPATASRR